MYPESILLIVLLAALRGCEDGRVLRDKNILDSIYLNQSITSDPEDGCDRITADIDECMDCYPCQHESLKDKQGVVHIKVGIGANVCSADAYLTICCVPAASAVRGSDTAMCGKRSIQHTTREKSNDGLRNTGFGEYPWVVAILSKCFKDYYFRCAGTLINGRTVLTTAGCVESARKNCTFKVRAGEWQFSSEDSDTEAKPYMEADVDGVIVHEHFNNFTFDNNIALLRLQDRIEPGTHIGFVCLDSNSAPSADSECYVAGWGKPSGSKDRHRDIMRVIKMKHLEQEECKARLHSSELGVDFKLDRSYRCAVGVNGETTMKGDGGAALICALKGLENRFVQYGIVALDLTFQHGGVPSLFTDVTIFKRWIDVKVEEILQSDNTLIKDPYIV